MKYANAQFAISLAAFAALIALTWYSVNVDWTWLVISYVYYKIVVGLLGNQIAQHRYFSHRSFATTSVKEWMLYFLSLTTGVNPVLYALAHRHHHCHSDQPRDLHSVHNHWQDIFNPVTGNISNTGDIEISRVLPSSLRKVNHYWLLIFLGVVVTATVIDWHLGIFVILAGPAWNYIHMILFRVWLVHVELPGSYRNYNIDDRSWNNKWIQLMDIGEGLHNNHHRYPQRYNQAIAANEVDPAGWIVKYFFTTSK
jgi:stearoyl-CoA desaturase (delta-9 desaturase)